MKKAHWLKAHWLKAHWLALCVVVLGFSAWRHGARGTTAQEPAPAAAPLSLAGSASCSGRGCHGGIEPRRGQACWQNEFTLWLHRDDKHTRAYDVLKEPLAKDIAKRLGIPLAHEDARCLSCHMTPQAALEPADLRLKDPKLASLVQTERRFGVGCESCHGSAEKWLASHTAPDWKKKSPAEKLAKGMIPVEDAGYRFKACAGCHVGAPAGEGAPRRDVNHDLIAAGHPVLYFEASSFFANLPAHWNDELKTRQERDLAQDWALGQLAAAEASVRLLIDRATPDKHPWPEFSEYSCYACHHDLQAPSWRQQRDAKRLAAGRKPGALPWGGWYLLMPRLQGKEPLTSLVADLEQAMTSRLRPDEKKVRDEAENVLRQLALQEAAVRKSPPSAASLLEMIQGFDWPASNQDWETAEQLFLASLALSRADKNQKLEESLLSRLLELRAFPPTFNSPRRYDPAKFHAEFLATLKGKN